jgi:hypothetical protein
MENLKDKAHQKVNSGKFKIVKADELRVLFKKFTYGIGIFTIGLAVLVFFMSECSRLNSVVTFIAVAAGCLAFGASIGFLFGIPRAQKEKLPSTDGQPQSNGYYNDNTNLEEISDWLTKIILGLALVELQRIMVHVDNAAINFSNALAGQCCETCNEDYYPFAYAAIVFYFLMGGGISYLWARSSLLSILEERRFDRLQKQNQQLNDRNEKLYNKLSEANKIVNTSTSPATEPPLSVDEIKSDDTKTKESIINPASSPQKKEFRAEVLKLYRNSKIRHPDDTQLDRWGGLSTNNNVRLTAKFNPLAGSSGFYGIELTVESLSSDQSPGEEVAFFLHDSFPREIEFVPVINNRATLNIRAFEAFTVGVMTESGIALELNLNDVKGFPPDFYY